MLAILAITLGLLECGVASPSHGVCAARGKPERMHTRLASIYTSAVSYARMSLLTAIASKCIALASRIQPIHGNSGFPFNIISSYLILSVDEGISLFHHSKLRNQHRRL